ncbi:MAG: hypothetical protein ACO1NQ_13700, partial [Flavobacteriales bacterium]
MHSRSLFVALFGSLVIAACRPQAGPDTADQVDRPWTLSSLDSAIIADPRNPALFAQRAKLNAARDSVKLAINDWKRAIILDSTNFRWRIGLGDLYYSKADLTN